MADTTLAVPKPTSDSMERVVKAMVASRLFTDVKDAAQAYARIHLGRSLGLNDYSALTGLYITKGGRPALSANTMAQLIKSYTPPGFPGPKYRVEIASHTNKECVLRCYERIEDYTDAGKRVWKWKDVGTCSFTDDDAKTAGLLGGDVWRKYMRNLLFARAISNAAKWFFADAFGQLPVYLPDETEDTNVKVNPETLEVVQVDAKPVASKETTQRQVLTMRIAETDTDPEKLKAFYKVDSLDDLSDDQVVHAVRALDQKRAAQAVTK